MRTMPLHMPSTGNNTRTQKTETQRKQGLNNSPNQAPKKAKNNMQIYAHTLYSHTRSDVNKKAGGHWTSPALPGSQKTIRKNRLWTDPNH
jgi:hypothetical protein